MYCEAKEGMENCYVCMFTSKGRIVRQLLSVFTHQLPNSMESSPESPELLSNGCVSKLVFQVKQARVDVGASRDKTHISCSMRQPENSVS